MEMQKKKQTETDVLRDIESGKFRDCYLMYNRQSTDEAESQKNSLGYQTAEIGRFVARERLTLAPVTLKYFCRDGIISEKHSAFKEDDDLHVSNDGFVQYRIERPKFHKLVQHLSRGHFKGVVCLCWDRISRNQGEDSIIGKLRRNGVDVRFAFASYDNSSSGELHMDIDQMFSRHHSRVTSEKVTATLMKNRSEGKVAHRAPIGYLNTGNVDHKPLDPERAPVIREMFELYATGQWSLSDLARHANDQGMTTVPMRRRRTKEEMLDDEHDQADIEKTTRPITENHVSRILTNLFYTGRTFGEDGIPIKSTSHEALVSDEVFDQVQAVLGNKKVSVHYTEKLNHPLRGMLRCAHCQRVYTPYEKKGILYFGARCRKDCRNELRNCNLEYITTEIRALISNLHFTADEIEEINAHLSTDLMLLSEKQTKAFEQIERKKKRIREDLTYLDSNRLQLLKTDAYTPESFVSEQRNLESELANLKTDENNSDVAMRDMMEDVVTLSELVENAVDIYDFADPHKKEQIIKTIFSELYLDQNTLEYKVHKGFEPLEDRFSAMCDPIAWLSELGSGREYIQMQISNLARTIENSQGERSR